MSGVVYSAPAGPRNPSADPRDQFPRPRINATGARNTRLTPREPQRQGNSTAISSTNLGRTADSGYNSPMGRRPSNRGPTGNDRLRPSYADKGKGSGGRRSNSARL
jgi:hypothetical protein